MLYQKPTFSCPSAPPNMTQESWDRIWLPDAEFEAKYLKTKYPKQESRKGEK